ncbi:NEW3 domain-containing protein [Chloroflexota bacterium]
MKIRWRIHWLPVFLVCVMAILSPCRIMAQDEKIDLTLKLLSDSYYNRITAGEDKTLFLEIGNGGNQAITNIQLNADKPESWSIQFRPERIDYLSPGSSQMVDVIITPSTSASKGEYVVTLIAEASEVRRVTSIYVMVESAPFWVWVGAGVAAVVIAGFIFVFMRFRRQ